MHRKASKGGIVHVDSTSCGGLRWRKHSAFLLLLLVLLSFSLGCNNKKASESDSANQAAREALELREAAASVLLRAFDEGRLGPKEKVVAVMQIYAARFRPLNQALPKFFTDEGHLLSIRELNEDQRI